MYEKTTYKDVHVEGINVHLADILYVINPFDFAPVLTLHSGFILITNGQTSEGGENVLLLPVVQPNPKYWYHNWTNHKAAKYCNVTRAYRNWA